MDKPEPDDLSLPCALCNTCGQKRLVHGVLAGDELVYACLDCDTRVAVAVEWVTSAEAIELGYFVTGHKEKAKGERGCRSGACGIQQPT